MPSRNRKSSGGDEDEAVLRATGSPSRKRTGPLPLREFFIYPVIVSVSNYVALAFLNTTLSALLPLFMAMSIENRGLGLPPPTIGLVISTYGVATGCVQFFLFAPLVHRYGEKRVFFSGMITCLPVFALFPLISMIAQQSGLSVMVWILVGFVLALGALMDLSFGPSF